MERRPERADRRAKLVVPTERGREATRLSDEIVAGIEQWLAGAHAKAAYTGFTQTLRAIVDRSRGRTTARAAGCLDDP